MNAKGYFALALRILGAVFTARGLWYLADSLLGPLGYFGTVRTSFAYYFIIGLTHCVVGLYLLRGAPFLVRFAYPPQDDSLTDDELEAEEESQVKNQEPE